MQPEKAERLAKVLMEKHGLTVKGWKLRFNNRTSALGIAVDKGKGKKWVGLSLPFIRINTKRIVREAILHEIAHALRGVSHGHDLVWRQLARSIGASGKTQFCDSINRPQGIGRWLCGHCKFTSYIYRKPKNRARYACRKCLREHGDTRLNQTRFTMKLEYYCR